MLQAQERHTEKLRWTHTACGFSDSLSNLCKAMLVILAMFIQQDLRVFLSSLVWLHALFTSKSCIHGRFECIPQSLSPGSLLLAGKPAWKAAKMCFTQVSRVSAQGTRTTCTVIDIPLQEKKTTLASGMVSLYSQRTDT